MIKHNFKKLTIWLEKMTLFNLVYDFKDTLPAKEKFNLISQLERCSVSVPSNIAEGSGKRTNIHFTEFLTIALTSAYEIETQLLICEMRKCGNQNKLTDVLEKIIPLQTQILNFRDKIINS